MAETATLIDRSRSTLRSFFGSEMEPADVSTGCIYSLPLGAVAWTAPEAGIRVTAATRTMRRQRLMVSSGAGLDGGNDPPRATAPHGRAQRGGSSPSTIR